MKRLELEMEALIFSSRWLLAPFFLGLIVAIVVLLSKSAKSCGRWSPTYLPAAAGMRCCRS
ncbi:MAG: hypothetical protein V7642_2404 [Burkholderiales bacterium]